MAGQQAQGLAWAWVASCPGEPGSGKMCGKKGQMGRLVLMSLKCRERGDTQHLHFGRVSQERCRVLYVKPQDLFACIFVSLAAV